MYSFRKRKQERSETQREREMRVESRRGILEDREREMERHRDACSGRSFASSRLAVHV